MKLTLHIHNNNRIELKDYILVMGIIQCLTNLFVILIVFS